MRLFTVLVLTAICLGWYVSAKPETTIGQEELKNITGKGWCAGTSMCGTVPAAYETHCVGERYENCIETDSDTDCKIDKRNDDKLYCGRWKIWNKDTNKWEQGDPCTHIPNGIIGTPCGGA